MERLFGIRFWYGLILAYSVSVLTFAKNAVETAALYFADLSIFQSISTALSPEYQELAQLMLMLIIATILPAALLHKQVFIFFSAMPWIGNFLKTKIFPDLNGEWDVELVSNWPRIKAMQISAASHDVPRYNANEFHDVPLEKSVKFKAKIEQTWTHVSLDMWSDDPEAVVKQSKSRCFDLIRRSDGTADVAYFYDQVNQETAIQNTDKEDFLGSAYLSVSEDGTTMSGVYMTRRAWEKGLNTAGTITFKRP